MFSVIISFTESISRFAAVRLSAGGAVLNVLIVDFSVVLNAAVPYAGNEAYSVSEEGNCDRNFFLMSKRKAKGMRRPSSLGAMTRYVMAA